MSSPENATWSLYDKNSKAKMTGLSFSQVRTLVTTFEGPTIGNWLAWYESLTDWKPLADLLPVLLPPGELKVYVTPPNPPPVEGQREMRGPIDEKDSTTPPAERLVAEHDYRITKRFERAFKVVGHPVAGTSGTFATETEDISITGMKLKKGLPTSWQVPCSFTLSNKLGKQTDVIATLVPEENEKRNRFIFVRVPYLIELHAWLLDPKA